MSWNNVSSELYRLDSNTLRENAGHTTRLSATHLLLSPDGSRNLLANSTDNDFSTDGVSLFNRIPRPRNSMFSVFGCCFSCQRSVCVPIKEYLARKKIERGLRLYEKHHPTAAVKTWQSALQSCSKREDRFVLLSYLYQAHMDFGKFRDALDYGHHQLGISEELDNPQMRSEAYLNLARAHEKLGCLERSLMYARHSLYNECEAQSRNGGLVHLTVASVYLELGGFRRCLEGLQGAHKIAMNIGDTTLELQVYVLLSELFHRLCDFEKSARYASKAYDLSRSLQLGDLNSRHHRAALLRMASALRKQGELGDARDYVEEATRLALISGDQASYTRSIRILGDIYRKKLDIDRAFRQYEQAMGAAANMADRMSQMEAMDGAARCLESLRIQNKICSCRPLEFNTRLLEVCNSIGSKMLVRKVRLRLAQIYRSLGDEENYQNHIKLATQIEHSLGLNCCLCGETYGLENDSLEALPCAHILHSRCAQEILRNRDKNNPRQCPACNHLFNSNLHLCAKLPPENDEIINDTLLSHANSIRPAYRRSNLSLASLNLRASSLTINSDCNNITSSV